MSRMFRQAARSPAIASGRGRTARPVRRQRPSGGRVMTSRTGCATCAAARPPTHASAELDSRRDSSPERRKTGYNLSDCDTRFVPSIRGSSCGMLAAFKLRSPLEKHRIDAISDFCRRADANAIENMVAALSDRSAEVRILACEGLGRLGAVSAIEEIERLVTDPDPHGPKIRRQNVALQLNAHRVRAAAAAALATMPDGKGLPVLGRIASSTDRDARLEAVQALSRVPDEESATALADVLADNDPKVVKAAFDGLVGFGHLSVCACARAMTAAKWWQRSNAAKILSAIGWQPDNDRQRAQYLVLQNRIPDAVSLGRWAIEPLRLSLEDPNLWLNAAAALLELGDNAGIVLLQREVNDLRAQKTEEAVAKRLQVFQALEGTETQQAASLQVDIINQLHRDGKLDQHELVERLRLQGPGSVPLLVGLLGNGALGVDKEICGALLEFGLPGRPALIEVLEGRRYAACSEYVYKRLLEIDTETVKKHLQTVIRGSYGWDDFRWAARELSTRFGNDEVSSLFRDAFQCAKDFAKKRICVQALLNLGLSDGVTALLNLCLERDQAAEAVQELRHLLNESADRIADPVLQALADMRDPTGAKSFADREADQYGEHTVYYPAGYGVIDCSLVRSLAKKELRRRR